MVSGELATIEDADAVFLLWAVSLVFFMQCGFTILEAGTVQTRNVKHIILKNLADTSVTSLAFYIVGFGIAYGGNSSPPVIGNFQGSFLIGTSEADYAFFCYQLVFAGAATTVASGAVAERTYLIGYVIYSIIMSGFIYPVVVHSIWSSTGWMSVANDNALFGAGVADFAGGLTVHLTGAAAGLAGTLILRPRIGRFSGKHVLELEEHSPLIAALGVYILWFGWIGFNAGSALTLSGDSSELARRALVNTLVPPSVSGTLALVVSPLRRSGDLTVSDVANVILSGLVFITPGAGFIPLWAGVVGAIMVPLLYHCASALILRLRIDDPLDAIAVHGVSAIYGVLWTSLFAEQHLLALYGGRAVEEQTKYGLFLGGGGVLLLNAIIAIILTALWSFTLSFLLFGLLYYLGIFRIPDAVQAEGIDTEMHGGGAKSVAELVTTSMNEMRASGALMHPPSVGDHQAEETEPSTQSEDSDSEEELGGSAGGLAVSKEA